VFLLLIIEYNYLFALEQSVHDDSLGRVKAALRRTMNSDADWPASHPPIVGIVSERLSVFHSPHVLFFALLPSYDKPLAIDCAAAWRMPYILQN
jgi:hypothetical protein